MLKSIRTALVIGLVTTLVTLPLAVVLGIVAGYFRGWVDDVIQYLYTTLNSIPGVLLIAAAVLMMQVLIDTHPQWFSTAAERADLRLLALCFILGLTSWTGLARLLRGEVLKLRELEYVQAAQAFGVSDLRIIARHLLPNLMHIVIIALVMDFSGLVLAEAVLSYVGIGVDPTMISFGTMINNARMELGRNRSSGGRWWRPSFSCSRWCWRPTCSPTPCATPSIRGWRDGGERGDKVAWHAAACGARFCHGLRLGKGRAAGGGGDQLRCRRGRDLCAAGESGCGKSATALALMRLLPAPGACSGARSSSTAASCSACRKPRCASCAAAAWR